MKVREPISVLEADGWFCCEQKVATGSFITRQKKGTVTVSGKAGVDMPAGTLHSVLKQAGLKKQE